MDYFNSGIDLVYLWYISGMWLKFLVYGTTLRILPPVTEPLVFSLAIFLQRKSLFTWEMHLTCGQSSRQCKLFGDGEWFPKYWKYQRGKINYWNLGTHKFFVKYIRGKKVPRHRIWPFVWKKNFNLFSISQWNQYFQSRKS